MGLITGLGPVDSKRLPAGTKARQEATSDASVCGKQRSAFDVQEADSGSRNLMTTYKTGPTMGSLLHLEIFW